MILKECQGANARNGGKDHCAMNFSVRKETCEMTRKHPWVFVRFINHIFFHTRSKTFFILGFLLQTTVRVLI